MDPELQKRYFDLRKQLSSLNYSTNFGLDAVDAVQQLFGDLISTTESYSQLQEKEFELSQDLSLAQAQLFPLKKENAKLSRENQQLHMDTVKLREELTDHQDTLVARNKELEDQLKEVTYLCNQKDESIRKGEQQRIRLREAYEQLASSSLLSGGVRVKRSVKMTHSLVASGTSPTRNKLSELGFDESKSPENEKKNKKEPKENKASSTRMAAKKIQEKNEVLLSEKEQVLNSESQMKEDKVISSLQKQVETLRMQLRERDNQNFKLGEQLKRREDEWVRMSRQLASTDVESGNDASNKNKIQSMMAADISNQRIIEQLNGQVDFLNEHLALRESQLAESTKELQGVRELQSECEYRGVQLEQAKENNARLSGQLKMLEQRLDELQYATDPENKSLAGSLRSEASTHRQSPTHSLMSQHDDDGNTAREERALSNLKSDKDDLTSDLEKVNNKLRHMEEGDALLQARLSRTEAARVALRDELSAANAQIENIQARYHDSQDALRRMEEEKEELTLRYEKTQTALQSEAEAADVAKSKVQELESQVAILDSAKKRLETALSELKDEVAENRKRLSSTSIAKDDTDFQLRRLTQEKENAELIAERTQKELSITQDKMMELDASKMQLEDEMEAMEKQNALLRSQLESSKSDLNTKRNDHEELLEKYMKLDQTNRELHFNLERLQERLSQSASDSEVMNQLVVERDEFQQKFDDIQRSSDALSNQVFDLQSQVEELISTRVAIQTELDEKSSRCETLQTRLDASEQETKRLEELISQRGHSSASQDGLYDSLSEKLNAATLQNSELQAEVRLANRRLFDEESKCHKLDASLQDLQHSHQRTSAILEKTEKSLSELRDKYDGVKTLLRQREEELSDLNSREERQHRYELDWRRDLKVALEEKDAAEKKVDDLKVLIKSMESDDKDNSSRMKRYDAKIHDLQCDIDRITGERDDARCQLKKTCGKVEELQDALKNLDADRDELQNQLDEYEEMDVRKHKVLSEAKQRSEDLSQLVAQRDSLIESLKRDKEHARIQLESLNDRFRALTEENSDLRRRLSMKQNEVGAASEDLQLMTRENQSVTTELAAVSNERDRLKQKVMQFHEQINELEHSVRALEIERGDLLETYRTCLQEKRKYEVDLNVMSESKARLARTINELKGDLADATGELNSRRNNESRQMSERSALLLQVESLNDQLIATVRKVEDREAEINKLIREKDGLQQTVLTLQQRSQTLVSRAASATDSTKVLQARLTALERERDALRARVDGERRRSDDMAQIIAASRTRDALQSRSNEHSHPHSTSSRSFHSSDTSEDRSAKEVSSLSNEV